MKLSRFDLWLGDVKAEIRWWLQPPPAQLWPVLLPFLVAIATILTYWFWRQGEL